MRALIVALMVVAASPALAGRHDAEAKDLYNKGEAAYRSGDFETAYADFKRAYFLAAVPELLFNMASAAKELNRPGDAAEHLRAYLRTVPDTPKRADIERRIRALVEVQTMLDADRAREKPIVAPAPVPAPAPVVAPVPEPTATIVEAPPPKPDHKRAWIIGGTVGGVVIVGAVALGLALGIHHTQSPTAGNLSNVQATP